MAGIFEEEIGSKNYKTGSLVDAFINEDDSSFIGDFLTNDLNNYMEETQDDSLSGFFKSRTPAKNKYENIPFGSTFFQSISGLTNLLSNPFGFIWKFVSLVFQPLIFGFGAYFFFNSYMEQNKIFSLVLALVFYFESLRESIVCTRPRPSFKEIIELFAHQNAILWLMWTFGSATYSLMRAENSAVNGALIAGLIVASIVWWFVLPYVSSRAGANGIIKYFYQVIAVIFSTAVITLFGYALSPYIWKYFFSSEANFFRCYAITMLFGFVGFWISVNQFYYPSRLDRRLEERGEEILEL